MIDFLELFFDVVLHPVDPANLNLENDPIMTMFILIILIMGIVKEVGGIWRCGTR